MLGLFSAFVAARAPAFQWPPSYTIHGTWKVPYTNLSNPITISHEPHRQYTNQLNGVEQIWNTGPEDHLHRKIVGAGDKFICYGYSKGPENWDLEMTQFLPDSEGYRTQEGLHAYNGRLCKLHVKTEAGGKTQTWKVYTDNATGYPVGYVAQAVSVFGSHYDLYVLDIDKFVPEPLPGVWQLPAICKDPAIEDDPYPGNGFNLFFPGKKAETGAGKFAHMDPKRWLRSITKRRRAMLADVEDKCEKYTGEEHPEELPDEFTWRDRTPMVVGPPRDQVACGSCWAFGTAEIIESAFARATGEFKEISVNQIMDCTWDNGNNGCQGGEVNRALTSMMNHNIPVAYEKDYPYIGVSGMCLNNTKYYKEAGVIKRCFHIGRKKEVLKQALMKFGPIAININVVESMLFYNGGVFNDTTCTGAQSDLVHSVLLTGWKIIDGVECWEVKNSWSTYWGYEGYVYIQAEEPEWNCGVTTDAVAVEVTVSPSLP